MIPIPYIYIRSRPFLYVALALVGALAVLLLMFYIKGLQHKIEVLESQVREYKTAYEAQKTQTERANAAVAAINKKYRELSSRFESSQLIYQKAIQKYKRLLDECLAQNSKPIIIKNSNRKDCPKIEKIDKDPTLGKLRHLFQGGEK